MRQVLIGRTGRLAAHLANRLGDVDIYSRSSENYFDLADEETISNLKIKNSIVYFTTAISSPDFCEENFSEAWKLNVENTIAAIKLLISGGNKVVFFSSDVVYGDAENRVTEASSVAPKSGYALMKVAVERYFEKDENFTSIRLSYIFTGDDSFSQYIKSTNLVEIYDGIYRNVAHIDHLIYVLKEIRADRLQRPVVNVVGKNCVSRRDLFDFICSSEGLERASVVRDAPPKFFLARPQIINCQSLYVESKSLEDY